MLSFPTLLLKPSHLIAFNTLVSYGQSLVELVVGLFSARWVLEALAQGTYTLNHAIFSQNRRRTVFHEVNCARIKVHEDLFIWCAYKMPVGAITVHSALTR